MIKSFRSRAVVGLAAALAVAGAVVIGQAAQASTRGTPGASGVGDTVYPNLGNGGYQVAAYLLDFRYDAQTKLIDAKVTIHAKSTQALSRFNLDAFGLDIASVAVNGTPAQSVQEGEELVITPAQVVPKTTPFTVDVKYSADPRRVKPPAGGFVANEDGFATAPQPAGAHTVFPSNDHPSDKAYFAVKVTAPAGLTGVASGSKLSSKQNPDGSTTSLFFSENPLAPEVLQVAVGDYVEVGHGTADGAKLRDLVSPARLPKLQAALDLTPAQLAWAKLHLGPFPLEAYGLLPVNNDSPTAFDFTGLETQTLTLYKPNYLAQTEDKIGSHMMHEIVHSWFGNSVTPKDWGDLWFNEGHADFWGLTYRYERGWPDSRGYTTLPDRMKFTYSQGDIWRKTSGPVAKPNAANLFDNQRYTGGVLVLYALRNKVGADSFDAIERTVLARHKNGTISTQEFIALATEVSGDASVKPFLTDWLYGTRTPPMPGHPDWTVDPVPTTVQRGAMPLDLQHDRRNS